MRDVLAIAAIDAALHSVLVACVVIPFGWDAMNAPIEAAFIAVSTGVAILAVRLSTANEERRLPPGV